jgi:hypothetical protein
MIMYTLLYKPNGQFPCKRKYLHDAKSDDEAIEMATEYAAKKKATIHDLTKTVKIVTKLM